MTLAMPRLFGAPDEPLNATESRALRTSLGMERRHVAVLTTALRLTPAEVDQARVVSWERSNERGYPPAVCELLAQLNAAVDALGMRLASESERLRTEDRDTTKATIRRPVGSLAIAEALQLDRMGIRLPSGALEALDRDGGAVWQALCDAAVTRAALSLRAQGFVVGVVADKPTGQSAR